MRVGMPNNVAAVATGWDHNVAVTSDGGFYTWGDNRAGQFGLGFLGTPQPAPLQVGTDADWSSVSFGAFFTVALKRDGTLWSWGLNGDGQLGDGTTIGRSALARVGLDSDWVAVTAGESSALAIKQNGTLWGWGQNFAGLLGMDPFQTSQQLTPIQIGTDRDWTAAAAGRDHSLALKADGSLWAWGGNGGGQLGDGTTTSHVAPTRIGTDNDWQMLTVGGLVRSSSFALKKDGSLWAWGANGVDFQVPNADFLGVGDTANQLKPVRLGRDSDWRGVFAGFDKKFALKADGTLWTWQGFSGLGAVFSPVNTSVDFIGFDANGNAIFSAQLSTLELRNPASLLSKLLNRTDQISQFVWNSISVDSRQMLLDASLPLDQKESFLLDQINVLLQGASIFDPQRFAGIVLDAEISALLAQNPQGEGLIRLNRLLLEAVYPAEIAKLSDRAWTTVSVGQTHWLGVRNDGSLWTEGLNVFGELGDGTLSDPRFPVPVGRHRIGAALDWKEVASGQQVSAAIKTDGTLWTWGNYAYGLLGNPSLLMPRAIGNSANWAAPTP
jgi:alpha-tubulin suppressor-like RCC1 family protein